MNKKSLILISSSIILILITYTYLNSTIGDPNSLIQKIKLSIPYNIRLKLKETIFVHKNQENLKKQIIEIKKRNDQKLKKIFSNENVKKRLIKYYEPLSLSELVNLRQIIKEKYVLDLDQVKFSQLDNFEIERLGLKNFTGKKKRIFKIKYYDLIHYGFFEKAKNSKKLLIYNQGHGGSPFEFEYFSEIKKKFISQDYDILSLSMTGIGFNEDLEIDFPGYKKNKISSNHYTYKTFYDPEKPNKEPLSLMTSGNYYLIKNLINNKNYEEIIMVGISGGGWYTTILSAIIPEIKTSYSFAGTMPILLRVFDKFAGDWEQYDSSLFEILDYDSLYILSTLDEKFNSTRRHVQVYNNEDPCCFNEKSANLLKFILNENYAINNLEIKIVDNNQHSIDTKFLFNDYFK